ncbi:hypothetical protein MA16_Dca026762 [Dendrobium catenatum]|uniref:Uncharacterized protein n=1 Tax=Dendrobium catenatum TaxID=906689 RepID=A0A2I0VJE3_9ASPA|nr:hypothetical protein MA16_Dca026762 [Dendrobium catenatum]
MEKDKKNEESKPEEIEDPFLMDRWIPSKSTNPLQYELYKLQSWMHLCTERYMKKKQCLQDQFMKEREEILKKYEEKIKEFDAPSSPPQKKSKANSSGDESSSRGV